VRPSLVIFDCDGVLVDSEAVGRAVLTRMLRQRGSAVTEAEVDRRFRGMTIEEIVEEFCREREEAYDPSFAREIRHCVEAALEREEVDPIPGAPELVKRVQDAGLAACVASSGSLAKMTITLGQVGLLQSLEGRLFSAQELGRGKPAPDIFLHAAAAMGFPPAAAVVIEDSLAGIAGARAAGMRVFGFTHEGANDPAAMQALGAEPVARLAQVPVLIGLA